MAFSSMDILEGIAGGDETLLREWYATMGEDLLFQWYDGLTTAADVLKDYAQEEEPTVARRIAQAEAELREIERER